MVQLRQELNRTNGLPAGTKSQIAYWEQSILHFLTLTYAMQYKYGSRKQKCSEYGKDNKKYKSFRIISFKDRTEPSDPLYANHKILKLQNIIILNNCLFIYDQLCSMWYPTKHFLKLFQTS